VAAEEGDQLVIDMTGFLAAEDGSKGEPLPAVAGGEGITVPLEVRSRALRARVAAWRAVRGDDVARGAWWGRGGRATVARRCAAVA
jgi:hypothetical protein